MFICQTSDGKTSCTSLGPAKDVNMEMNSVPSLPRTANAVGNAADTAANAVGNAANTAANAVGNAANIAVNAVGNAANTATEEPASLTATAADQARESVASFDLLPAGDSPGKHSAYSAYCATNDCVWLVALKQKHVGRQYCICVHLHFVILLVQQRQAKQGTASRMYYIS